MYCEALHRLELQWKKYLPARVVDGLVSPPLPVPMCECSELAEAQQSRLRTTAGCAYYICKEKPTDRLAGVSYLF